MTPEELIAMWTRGVRILHSGHMTASAIYTRRHRLFGIPVMIASTVVGTSIFASLQEETHLAVQICIGLISMAAAIMSGLQTFLGFAELGEKHKTAAVKYGILRRELDEFALFPQTGDAAHHFVSDFRTRWDAVDTESPVLPPPVYNQALKEVRKYPLIGLADTGSD